MKTAEEIRTALKWIAALPLNGLEIKAGYSDEAAALAIAVKVARSALQASAARRAA